MTELELELERLQHENMILLGLMAGGYAYFLRQFMVGQQAPDGLSPQLCEQTMIDALRRVLATQNRFGYDYVPEIEAVLGKMTETVPLGPYLQKAAEQLQQTE